jgi:quercetin dioxygenase-like cupin family protein
MNHTGLKLVKRRKKNMKKQESTIGNLITDVVKGPIPPRVDNDIGTGNLHIKVKEIVDRKGPAPWIEVLIEDERNIGTLIASAPDQGNRAHWHKDFDEWWVVMAGKLRWELTGGRIIHAKKGDIVWVPRGTVHHIMTEGDEMSLRFAVAMPPAEHVWQNDCENCNEIWEPRKPS